MMSLSLNFKKEEINGENGLPHDDIIPTDHIIKTEQISRSLKPAYKGVYLGFDVVIKTIYFTNDQNLSEKTYVDAEIALLKCCRHPNILTFMGLLSERDQLSIVLEQCKYDLAYLLDSENPITWISRAKIGLDVACGLAYLHSRNISIIELKPFNIYLDQCGIIPEFNPNR